MKTKEILSIVSAFVICAGMNTMYISGVETTGATALTTTEATSQVEINSFNLNFENSETITDEASVNVVIDECTPVTSFKLKIQLENGIEYAGFYGIQGDVTASTDENNLLTVTATCNNSYFTSGTAFRLIFDVSNVDDTYSHTLDTSVENVEYLYEASSANESNDSISITKSECIRYTQDNIDYYVYTDHALVFSFDDSLSEAYIPAEVNGVPVTDFSSINNTLASVEVDEENQYLASKDGVVFNKDMTELISYPQNKADVKYTIPDTVTEIGESAFYVVSSLENLTIPESVNTINRYGISADSSKFMISGYSDSAAESFAKEHYYDFYDIEEDAYLSKSVSGTLGENLTWSLDSVGILKISGNGEMPKFIQAKNCSASPWLNFADYVTELIIDEGVTSVTNDAFAWFPNITEVTIPSTVKSIGYQAFYQCTGLETLTFADGSKLQEIGDEAFRCCSSLKSKVVLPNNLETIGASVFSYCTSLSDVDIPLTVTAIGTYAFCGTPFIANQTDDMIIFGSVVYKYNGSDSVVTIPNGVTYIVDNAFIGSDIVSVSIPQTVESIGSSVFSGCSLLETVNVPDDIKYIGNGAFYETPFINNQTDDFVILGKVLYKYQGNDTQITIPDNIVSISANAFSSCSSAKSIIVPDGVVSIGQYAFSDCSSLTEITIPDSVTSIEGGAFENCISLEEITIPSKVTLVEGVTFEGCTSLKKIIIPDGVTSIGEYVFRDCTLLENIVIPDSVTSLGYGAFYNCTSLTSIVIPENPPFIRDYTFYNCTALKSVTIPKSVSFIEECAFENCNLLAITGYKDSYAKQYASENNIQFVTIAESVAVEATDVNGDGKTSVLDLITLKSAILNDTAYSANYDINEDEKISVLDLISLKKFILSN